MDMDTSVVIVGGRQVGRSEKGVGIIGNGKIQLKINLN